MGRQIKNLLAALAACGVLAPVAAYGELPPSAYVAKQKAAPEFLVLEVMDVVVEGSDPRPMVVEARARVKQVHRTSTGLAVGIVISIRYHIPPWPPMGHTGPSSPPVLQSPSIVPAYLRLEGRYYGPAAGGKSFTTVNWPP